MEVAVAHFLRSAHSLRQCVVGGASGTPNFDLVFWTRQFKHLVDRLGGVDDDKTGKTTTRTTTTTTNSNRRQVLAESCSKLCNDILIRLKRLDQVISHNVLSTTTTTIESQSSAAWVHTVFTEHDMDALSVRLSHLRAEYNTLGPGNPTLEFSQVSTEHKGDTPQPDLTSPHSVATESVRARPVSAALLQEFILEALSFKSMTDREEEVATAHARTFDWVFSRNVGSADDTSKTHGRAFVEWLGSAELGSIYWVTGKPGSGKSTLIRYISNHDQTAKLLKAWAGDTQLAKASFYFWTSGSEEQRSQAGLLRSLLHQLLSANPASIPETFPHLWKRLAAMTAKERINLSLEWTIAELMSGFRSLLKNSLSSLKIFLFIDGLDEFDGDPDAIVHFFRDLAETHPSSSLKMCLSSRQWDVFENAFQQSVPNLKLQDMTFYDLRQYVSDNLDRSKHIRRSLRLQASERQTLVTEIAEHADGVFLWVRLVVGKILENFNKETVEISDIQRFVRELPTDLDDLFEIFLFRQQSERQLAETSEVFQLVRAREIIADFIKDESANSLTLWELAFALRAEDDALSTTAEVQEVADEDMIDRCIKTRSHVIIRSTGLLEVYAKRSRGNEIRSSRNGALGGQLAAYRVTYLHRTIRDYLMLSEGVWSRLVFHSAEQFDPHLRLLRSYVLRLKHPEEIEHHRRLDEWYPDIALSLTHARYIEQDPGDLQNRLVGELDKSISWYWLARPDDPHDHWARACFGTYEERKGNKMIIPHPFLALCTKFGLERYVINSIDVLAAVPPLTEEDHEVGEKEEEGEEEAEVYPEPLVEQTPLLSRALEFLTSRQKTKFPLSSHGFVHSLLRLSRTYGAHPVVGPLIRSMNTPYASPLTHRGSITPWIQVLRHLRDAKRRGWIEPFEVEVTGTRRWTKIVALLLSDEGGADRDAVIIGDSWDPEISTAGMLGPSGLLSELGDSWIEELGWTLVNRGG